MPYERWTGRARFALETDIVKRLRPLSRIFAKWKEVIAFLLHKDTTEKLGEVNFRVCIGFEHLGNRGVNGRIKWRNGLAHVMRN